LWLSLARKGPGRQDAVPFLLEERLSHFSLFLKKSGGDGREREKENSSNLLQPQKPLKAILIYF